MGRLLYSALIKILKEQNFINLYAWITTPNEPSEAFHERMGFEKICEIPSIGYKAGEWHGVSWYRLRVSDAKDPTPIIPFPTFSEEEVKRLLKN